MFRYGLSKDKKTFTANKFEGFAEKDKLGSLEDGEKIAVVLDVETTGFDKINDEVIEIAARKIAFDPQKGEIKAIGELFQALQEPSKPLPSEIEKLTGLSHKDLAGNSIDWQKFDEFIKDAVLIIAHNAGFDRPFVERHSKKSKEMIWACSASQVPWTEWFPSAKQEFLALSHGFFYDPHRSIRDVDALIQLLKFDAPEDPTSRYYFSHLLNNARKKQYLVQATNAPFETKDILRRRRYQWQGDQKVWTKFVAEDKLEAEKQFLSENIYADRGFLGKALPIPLKDNFK